jgi:hypothetical protein
MKNLLFSPIIGIILLNTSIFAGYDFDYIGVGLVAEAKRGHFYLTESVRDLIQAAKAGKVISEFSIENPLSSEDEMELRKDALLYIIPDPQKRESFLRELDNSGLDYLSIDAILAILPGYDI